MAGSVRKTWNNFPLFKLIIPFMAGIIFAVHNFIKLTFPLTITLVVFGILLLFLLNKIERYRYRWVFGGFSMFLIFLLGYFSLRIQINEYNNTELQQFNTKHKWLVETVSSPSEKENSVKLTVKVLASDSTVVQPEKALLYLEKDSTLIENISCGSRMIVYTQWDRPSKAGNPHQFNYRQYLKRNGIIYQSYVQSEHVSLVQGFKRTNLKTFINKLRESLLINLKKYGFTKYEFSLASAILLGKDDTMDPRLRSGFSTAGAMHILCVSGLHVGVIFLILDQMLKFLERKKFGLWLKAILLILMIWFYAALTGLDPSVLRASTMVSFVILGKTIRRPTSVYNALAASALLLLIIDPLIITQIGFQLSYLAVLSIVAFQPVLYKLWIPRNKLTEKIWAILTVSIAAQLGTFALAIHYFHIFPVYFLLTNLIVIPLSSFIIYTGFLFFISLPFQPLAWLFAKLLYGLLWFLKHSVFAIEKLPSASLNFLNLSVIQVLIIYATLLLLYIWINTYNRKALTGTLILLFVLSINFFYSSREHLNNNECVIYDAGRGVAVEAVSGKNHVVLMDSITYHDKLFVQYNMAEYWVQNGLKAPLKVNISEVGGLKKPWLFYENNSLVWNDYLFYILTDNKKVLKYAPEILIVHHHKAGPENIPDPGQLKKIILTGKVPPWKEADWINFTRENRIKLFKLSQGAVILQ